MLMNLNKGTFSCNFDVGYVVVVVRWTVCKEEVALVEFC